MMDRLDAMSLFLAVVETGSFAAAARMSGTSAASVTRAVAQLEESLATQLVERSTRHLMVTEAGLHHAAIYRQMLEEWAGLRGSGKSAGVSGTLVVTASELFGRLHVAPIVESFLALHPQVRIRLVLVNRIVDLAGEGVDIAIRLAHLPDSALTAVKVGDVRKLFCAAPAYLRAHGTPTHPGQLPDHSCIGLNDQGQQELWQFREEKPPQRLRSVKVNCRLTVSSAAATVDAARRGFGVIHPISYQVAQDMSAGALVEILTDYRETPMPVHLVFLTRKAKDRALRAFIDHAKPLLRAALSGNLLQRSQP
ncbi:LysR family transcriptional regulator [Brucellaceae bacterium D45D]